MPQRLNLGLEGAYGAKGAADALQELIANRLKERMFQEQIRQALAEEAFRTKQLEETGELRHEQQKTNEWYRQMVLKNRDEDQARADAAAKAAAEKEARTNLEEETERTPAGTEVGPGRIVQLQRAGVYTPSFFKAGKIEPGRLGRFERLPRPQDIKESKPPTVHDIQYMKGGRSFEETVPVEEAIARGPREQRTPAAPTVVVQTIDASGNPVTKIVPKTAGSEIAAPPTVQQRNQQAAYGRVAKVLKGLSELSERINTGQGLIAKAAGGAARLKAKANYDDDVAEYQALISGFTPLVARAVGHTGVLTELDVQSVRQLFPAPGDSKTLRDRKITRLTGLIGEMAGNAAEESPSPDLDAEVRAWLAGRKKP